MNTENNQTVMGARIVERVRLICMSFDGDYVTEGAFDSVQDAWNHDADLGSRWFFYPFHFVTTASGKTIKDACSPLEWTIGRRLNLVKTYFAKAASNPENKNMDAESFAFAL